MATRAYTFSLAAASGVLLALSFPKFGHPALAWIALAPLLLALAQPVTLLRASALGLACGVIYFGGTLYWMTGVMSVYGGLPAAVAGVLNGAFVVYLALYVSIFAIVMRRFLVTYGPRALAVAPLAWTATEFGRAHLFTGFPWVLLGYSQATMLPIAQFASVLGVFGVSALVASASAAIAGVALRRAYVPAAIVAALVGAIGCGAEFARATPRSRGPASRSASGSCRGTWIRRRSGTCRGACPSSVTT